MKSIMNTSRQARTQTAIVTCPDCGEEMTLKDAIRIHLSVRCSNCDAELKVLRMAPIELDWVLYEPKDEREFLVRW